MTQCPTAIRVGSLLAIGQPCPGWLGWRIITSWGQDICGKQEPSGAGLTGQSFCRLWVRGIRSVHPQLSVLLYHHSPLQHRSSPYNLPYHPSNQPPSGQPLLHLHKHVLRPQSCCQSYWQASQDDSVGVYVLDRQRPQPPFPAAYAYMVSSLAHASRSPGALAAATPVLAWFTLGQVPQALALATCSSQY